jgi:hypothetical protein
MILQSMRVISTSTTSSVLLVLILASSTVMGFNPSLYPQTSCRQYQTGGSKTILHARAGDSAKAIDDAVHKSRLYGPDSNEARVAWDIVEEIDAYLEPLLACTSAETAFGETPATTQSASNYANQMQNFSNLLNSVSPALAQIKSLATTLRQLGQIDDPRIRRGSPKISIQLAEALQHARAADYFHGPNSIQAIGGWDHVQLVSSGVPNVANAANVLRDSDKSRYKGESVVSSHYPWYYTVVDSGSLENGMEAIGILDHLMRLVRVECEHLTKIGSITSASANGGGGDKKGDDDLMMP